MRIALNFRDNLKRMGELGYGEEANANLPDQPPAVWAPHRIIGSGNPKVHSQRIPLRAPTDMQQEMREYLRRHSVPIILDRDTTKARRVSLDHNMRGVGVIGV